ncbi:MAG TPA: glycosyltransferase family 4 protein [Methyloceanibacter sp.]|nr:glycosyltransferase family 4 protein [Methyloceanibacter sp.]
MRLAAVAFGVVATLKQRVSAAVRAPARYIGSARRTIGSARRTISAVSSPQTWVAADNMMRDRIANGLEKRSHGSRVANVLRDPIAFGRAVTELARDSSKGLRASAAVDPLKGQKIVPVPVRFLDPSKLPSPEHPIRGKALYVRLDYWAKLKAGGSYGHTCFVAKSESRVTEQFECIMAQRYALLDSLGVSQRVLEAEYSSASIADLILSAPELLPQLRRVFDEGEVSYVYERSVLGNWCAAQLCQERGIPYIVEYNGSELAMARSFGTPHKLEGLLEQIEDYSFAAATMISVVSQPIADSLVKRGVAADKILVNPNCVDPDVYCPLPDPEREQLRAELGFGADDVVVGFCGTFGGWHGIDVLTAAIPTICQRDRRVSFLLIGDGNLKHLVNATIEQHGLHERVRDLGLVPQMEAARYLAACDILLSPHSSNIDGGIFFGSPTKLFEYMAIGGAIVCSDLAQLGEVMRPALRVMDFAGGAPAVTHQRGILVTPGVVDELVEAVGYLSSNAELRKALGSNARKAAIENFTWDSHVENLWRFLAGMPLKGYAQAGQRGEK